MSIKSKETVTKTSVESLLSNIKTLFQKRNLTITEGSSSLNLYSIFTNQLQNKQIEKNNPITMNNLGDLLNDVLIVNDIPNVLLSSQYSHILSDGTTQEVEQWVANHMNETGTSSNHGCRGACVGICTISCSTNCSYGCSNTATTTSSQRYPGSIGTKPNDYELGNYTCGGECSSECFGCGYCTGTCKGQCYKCGSGCNTSCNSGCTDQCGDCDNGCAGNCGNTCASGCQTSCRDGCAIDCKSTCYGTTTGGTYT